METQRSQRWYNTRETVDKLKGEVTEATVKEYCKSGKLKCKKMGPKKRWMILGSSIQELLQEWGYDKEKKN